MGMNKDKSEIADSFRNLLQKADEMALNKKKDDFIDKFNLDYNKNQSYEVAADTSRVSSKDRLGISNIKRIPENPFSSHNKAKSNEYLKNRKELIIKLSIILNKHIHKLLDNLKK